MKWMAKLEYKLGKYAIPNLTLGLIICYIIGYAFQITETYTSVSITAYLTLNPYAIVHGQVWRLISWIMIPPDEGNIFFTIIMLFFYFSIGRTLERTWGDFQYNVYIFSGMIFTVLGSFFILAYVYIFMPGQVTTATNAAYLFQSISQAFTTYYVNMSIFLAYAATFPDNQVLLMFIIPIKVKFLGIIYGLFIIYEMVVMVIANSSTGLWVVPIVVVAASLLNFLVFFLTTRRYIRMNHAQRKAHRAYEKQARAFKRKENAYRSGAATKHRCAVCGRTEKDDPNLTFRFCSKCEGNFEYCEDHLYTHIHFTKSGSSNGNNDNNHSKPEGFY